MHGELSLFFNASKEFTQTLFNYIYIMLCYWGFRVENNQTFWGENIVRMNFRKFILTEKREKINSFI